MHWQVWLKKVASCSNKSQNERGELAMILQHAFCTKPILGFYLCESWKIILLAMMTYDRAENYVRFYSMQNLDYSTHRTRTYSCVISTQNVGMGYSLPPLLYQKSQLVNIFCHKLISVCTHTSLMWYLHAHENLETQKMRVKMS